MAQRKSRDDAIARAMDDSVKQGIMTEFIEEHVLSESLCA